MKDNTRIYYCGGIPVTLPLPEGEIEKINAVYPFQEYLNFVYEFGDL